MIIEKFSVSILGIATFFMSDHFAVTVDGCCSIALCTGGVAIGPDKRFWAGVD